MRDWRKLGLVLALSCGLFCALPGRVQSSQENAGTINNDVKVTLELLSPINTETNQKGDKFSCKVVAPNDLSGAIVDGHVTKSKHSGKGTGKSELVLRFDSITLTDGRFGKFNATIEEVYDAVNLGDGGRADAEGTVKGKSRVKISIKRAVAGALIGAAIGAAIAGPKGAAAGAAIGSSVALSTVLATEGPNLEFKQGTRFLVALNEPSHLKRADSK